jgi:phosphatidylethanolamine-binding protein (PEBP) family uncharacterized protein
MKHVSPHRNSKLAVILFATALIILWGNAAMAMTLNSPAFQQNGHIPSKYTCEGEDVSPPLAWEGVPNGKISAEFALPIFSYNVIAPCNPASGGLPGGWCRDRTSANSKSV